MSLLLDALKRAEQEKLARQGEASNDAPPAQPAAKGAAGLELQPLSSASGPGPSAPSPTRIDDGAHAAQVMFEAKAPPGEGKRSRGMLWATFGAIAVVVAAAAAYVWNQIRLLSPHAAPVVARRAPPPPLPVTPTASVPPTVAPLDPPPRVPATVTIASDPPAAPAPVAPAPKARIGIPPPEDVLSRLLREAPPAPAEPPVNLTRTAERPAIPADVASGYDALRSGDLAQARRSYGAALASEPASLDALLGMATVEARSGNRTVAEARYRRALEVDPRNPTALAGLAALADGQAPEAVEAQLRREVARFPGSAQLRFALGSHYAAQRRWGEAQAAFFEAYRLEPAGADILFNLAVSLDHMNQPRLAADFYRRAVEAAQSQPTQFDPAPARRRIAELSAR